MNETEKWDREKEARRLTISSCDKLRYAFFKSVHEDFMRVCQNVKLLIC